MSTAALHWRAELSEVAVVGSGPGASVAGRVSPVCDHVLIAMSAAMTVERAGIVAIVGMIVGGVATDAGIVIAVRAAGVAVAVIVVAVADVEVAVDAVIVAAVV